MGQVMNPNLLSRWRREVEEDGGDPGSTASLQAELKRLRKENKMAAIQVARHLCKPN
jgi:transposase-like protein